MHVTFFVPGTPAPGGSKRAFQTASGRIAITDMGGQRTKDWRASVAQGAYEAANKMIFVGPLYVSCTFFLRRPKNHYRKNGELKPTAPEFPTGKPDATKLWRSTEDALTGVIWHDDAQIVTQLIMKRYGEITGAQISVCHHEGGRHNNDTGV